MIVQQDRPAAMLVVLLETQADIDAVFYDRIASGRWFIKRTCNQDCHLQRCRLPMESTDWKAVSRKVKNLEYTRILFVDARPDAEEVPDYSQN